jgi:hypothetical protein
LLQDNEVGKTHATGANEKRRIRLLLRGSSSRFESDRRLTGSPIEKIYETYGKTEEVVAVFATLP